MGISQTLVGLVAAGAALTGAGVPPDGYASGSGRPGKAEPGARLTVGYMADAGFAAAVKLDCDPAGGGHPQAIEACAVLDAAGGDPELIPAAHTACIMLYAPVVAEVRGTWQGEAIEWRHRYGNSCEMRRATAALFAF